MCVAETACRALRMLDPKSLTAWYSSDCSRGGCAGQWFSEDLAKIRASLKLFYLYNGSLYTTGNNGFQSGALSLVTDRMDLKGFPMIVMTSNLGMLTSIFRRHK